MQQKIGLNIYQKQKSKNMIFKRLEEFQSIITNSICTTQKDIVEIEEALSIFKSYLLTTKKNNGLVYVIGNGGSAGIASHFCNDLIKALKIPANTLVDSNVLTCLANDFGYDSCYSEALKVNLKKQDLLVAISSSGNSMNIIKAVKVANDKEAMAITLSGFDASNPLRQLGNLNIWLDRIDYGLVEMGHLFILHSLVDFFEKININKPCLVSSENA
ncbi:MAG: Phosphoheptose isomerase [Candidatus Anoxychlamydiales bacterium]|nr:Phosphoheptose isomerase [Candidatus Anoxychlamydiales bacterium]